MSAILDEFCRDFIDGKIIRITKSHEVEIQMLTDAGCTVADYEFAFHAWARARRVHDDWGYLRTTMFARRAEKKLALEEAQDGR